jgi:nucleoside-diphosphate-sugar epimerase
LYSDKLKQLKGRKILITGGAGMIGSTIALSAASHGAQITILDALLPLYGGNLFNLKDIKDEITFVKGDIRDAALVKKLVKDQDIIFDMAAQVSYIDSAKDPYLDLDINCLGHLNILEACRWNNRDVKIIFPSSRFVYGSIEYSPVDEKHPFNCLSIYGIHKLAVEKYLVFYHQYYGMSTIIFRIANPYGPRQQMKHSKYGIVNWFIRMALEGKDLTIFGEGSQIRDYIYVMDLAHAMLLAAVDENLKHAIFNIGSGKGISFRTMVETIARAINKGKVVLLPWPDDYAFTESGDYLSNISKIRQKLQWKPRMDFESGVRETIQYYQQYRDKYW